ncbi:MAG: FG-GAP repeat domain-containing protein [Pseudomarimonas sp.]
MTVPRTITYCVLGLASFPALAGAPDPLVFANGFEAAVSSLCSVVTPGNTTVATPQLSATLRDSFHESWLGSPAVADLQGDGTPEILAARSGLVIGWHINGTVVFRATVTGRVWSSPIVADLVSSQPGLEVAVAARGQIYAWNSAGTLLPGFPHTWRDEMRSIAAGDIDGDGDLELVVATTQRLEANGQRDLLYAVHHNGAPVVGFPPNTSGAAGCTTTCFVTGGFDQNVALGNVDADAALEVFAGHDNAYLSLHDGSGRAFDAASIFNNRDKISGVRSMLDYTLAQQGFANNEAVDNQGHFTNSAPAFADVDGDGIRELVILGSVQNAAQTDRQRGVAVWVMRPDGTRPTAWVAPYHAPTYLAGLLDFAGTNIVGATNQPAVANIDSSRPGPEFVFAGFDGRIHAVDSNRQAMWQHTYTTDARVLTGGVAIGDLSGDGRPEIVFASYSPDADKSNLFVLDALGNRLHTIPLPDRGVMSVPTLADADANGTLDIVLNLKDGVSNVRQVLVYTVPGAQANCLPWPTGRANLLRSGNPP